MVTDNDTVQLHPVHSSRGDGQPCPVELVEPVRELEPTAQQRNGCLAGSVTLTGGTDPTGGPILRLEQADLQRQGLAPTGLAAAVAPDPGANRHPLAGRERC